MLLKLFGAMMIILASNCFGFKKAAKYKLRPQQIRQLINCLASLKAYINYKVMPLPEALKACTKEISGPVRELFLTAASELEKNSWMLPEEAFKVAVTALNEELMLINSEKEILEFFAANIGQVDLKEQQHVFEVVEVELKAIEKQAVNDSIKNVNMYRYLGLCGGLALVIILL